MSSTTNIYARYGLGGNPFRNHTTNSIERISSVHANIDVDDVLGNLKEDVFFKRNSHLVLLVGDKGMGKTHRVMVAHAEALQNQLFSRLISFSQPDRPAMYQFVKSFLPKGSDLFSNDKWQRELAKLKKEAKKGNYDPHTVAITVSAAINQNRPSFVLLDDLDNIQVLQDHQLFIQFLSELASLLQPGVFFLVTASSSFASWLIDQFPQVKNLFHIRMLEPLSNDDSTMIMGKWLESFRLVDGLHPLFPFSTTSVHVLNSQGHGNVESLLDLSNMALTAAAFQKSVVITDQNVKEALLTVKEQKPSIIEEKKKGIQPTNQLQELLTEHAQTSIVDKSDINSISQPIIPSKVLSADTNKLKGKKINPELPEHTECKHDNDQRLLSNQHNELIQCNSSSHKQDGLVYNHIESPLNPNHFGLDSRIIEDVVESVKKQDVEITQMKSQHVPLVNIDDNGNRKNQEDPASILHHSRKISEQSSDDFEPVIDKIEKSVSKDSTEKSKQNSKGDHSGMMSKDKDSIEKPEINQSESESMKHKSEYITPKSKISKGKKMDSPLEKSKRVFRVRCPECSKDFTIELDKYMNSLTCPFCDFHGEL